MNIVKISEIISRGTLMLMGLAGMLFSYRTAKIAWFLYRNPDSIYQITQPHRLVSGLECILGIVTLIAMAMMTVSFIPSGKIK
jgi:hypothetical protein